MPKAVQVDEAPSIIATSTLSEPAAAPKTADVRAPRVASIDIFRGLTMMLMIFVNELAEVHGLPWWNYHAPARVDVMTYVDVVFPLFLFIVGLSLPLSIDQRLKKDTLNHIALAARHNPLHRAAGDGPHPRQRIQGQPCAHPPAERCVGTHRTHRSRALLGRLQQITAERYVESAPSASSASSQ